MKKNIIIRLVLLLSIIFAFYFTQAANINAGGTISSNTIWTADTVKVTSDVIVNNGAALTITAGTYVEFQGHYAIKVFGEIIANGTAADRITFTAKSQSVGWSGIRYENTTSTQWSNFEYCTFSYGNANTGTTNDRSGGAVFMYNFSKVKFQNCIFSNNYASYYGGAIAMEYNASPIIANCLIVNNSSGSTGGGLDIYNQSNPSLLNNTIANNSSSNGGGIWASNYSGKLMNCIIYGNAASNSSQIYGTSSNVSYCNIQGGYSYGSNIYDTLPGFISPASGAGNAYDGISADYSLSSNSYLIDKGSAQVSQYGINNFDVDGNFRFDNRIADIGAYEYISSTEVCGNISSNTTWSGNVLLNCDVTIDNGATLTIQPGTDIIATGHYKIDVKGRLLSQGTSDNFISMTAWNHDEGWLGITFISVPTSNDTSKIEYSKISYKNDLTSTYPNYYGAIFINSSSKVLIRNNIVFNNNAKYGGAIYLVNSNATIVGNLIVNNTAYYYGSGIYLNGSSTYTPQITNNTIAKNNSTNGTLGIGIYVVGTINPGFKNNIIYANEDNSGNHTSIDNIYPSSGLNITNSCIEGGYTGTGNISTDPSFKNPPLTAGVGVNVENYNFSLQETSGCIDAGSASTAGLNLPIYDLAGKNRNYSSAIDIGAYEDKSSLAVCGTISSNQIWDANTININCDVEISSGATVTIVPGTKVLFNGHYNIHVLGAIQALGAQGDSITFTSSNTSVGWDGIYIENPSISNDSSLFDFCRFEYANRTPVTYYVQGGAISVKYFKKMRITNSIFQNNTVSGSYGGGAAVNFYQVSGSSPVKIKNNVFSNNTATLGIVSFFYSKIEFKSNTIHNNTVSSYSGAANFMASDGEVFFNTFTNNLAQKGGVSIRNNYNNNILYFYNNLIANNNGYFIGGLYVYDNKAFIYNNTIVNNYCSTASYAGGVHFSGNADANFKNNIIYGNQVLGGVNKQIFINDLAADPKFYNNDIEGGLLSFTGSGSGINYSGVFTDNMDVNPDFVSASAGVGTSYNGMTADWSINQGSPLINMGFNNSLIRMPSIDLAQNERVFNGRIDIGAFENQDPIIAACTISSDTEWEADTIRVECDITINSGNKLVIKPGTYVLFTGHYQIQVDGSIEAIGEPNNRITFSVTDTTGFWDSTSTSGGWDGINFNSNLQTNDSSLFEYCNFTWAKGTNIDYHDRNGAAINIYNSSKVSIQNCLFSNNFSYSNGGALYIESSNIKFNNNIIANNSSGYMGGGVYFDDCNIELNNNTVVNNKAKYYGGMHFTGCESILRNCNVWGNSSFGYIGTTFSQLSFYSSAQSKIYNSNIQYGQNNIVYGNTLSIYQDNKDVDPSFINPTAGVGYQYDGASANWMVENTSEMLNGGFFGTTNSALDFAGNARIVGDTIDIGAFEIQISPSFITLQPNDLNICEGTNGTLSTFATVSANYQWQKNGAAIAGATNKNLIKNGIILSDSGFYHCIVSNAYGSISTDTVELKVLTAPIVTTSPSSKSECFGASVVFSADVTGSSPLTYQWYNSNVALGSGSSNQTFELGLDTIRNTANAYPSPFANYYFGNREQYLILASELTQAGITAGNISSLGFDVYASNSCPTLSNFEVKIGSTSSTVLSSAWISGLASVYSVSSYQVTSGWNNFGFTSAFAWDGTSNIVVEVCSNNSSWISNGNASVNQSTTSFNSSHYFRADNNTVCSSTSTTALSTNRPNIKFEGASSVSGSTSYSINSITSNSASNYYMIATNSCGSAQSNGATLGIKYKPTLTPISAAANICEDGGYTFSTTISQGTSPMTFQWYRDEVEINSANSLSYIISSSDTADAGIYYCKANNICGSDSTNQSVLVVNEKPQITSQSSSQSVCENQSISLGITSTGTAPLSYQWYNGSTQIPGATNNTFTISSVSASDAGTYYCKVSNACVSTPVSSNGIDLTVKTLPTISSQTGAIDVCSGSAAPLSVTASGTATLTYQWYNSSGSISSATNNTYTISSASTSDAGNYYSVVSNSCGSVTSNSIPLTVNSSPSVSSQPSPITKCEGQSAVFNIQSTGTSPLTYQWYKGGNSISGATNSTYLISPVSTTDAASYYCVATNSCGSDQSTSAALTVNIGPSITSQSTSTTICEGYTPTFQITASGTSPMTYQWYSENGLISNANNASYSITSADTSAAGNYYCIASNVCSSATSNSILLNVNQSPSIDNEPVSSTVCENLSTVFNVSASGSNPLSYQWYNSSGAISGATNSSYIIAQASNSNAGSYYVKVSNSCGNQTSNTATLTVNQNVNISGQSSSSTVCSGASPSLSITTIGTSPITFQWYKSGIAISGATNNTYSLTSVDTSDEATYYAIASNACNSVQSNQMIITVKEAPSISSQPSSATICNGLSQQLSVSASGSSPMSYQWYKGSTAISGATNTNYLISQVASTDAGSYYVKVSNSCGSVNSNNSVLIVNTAPSFTSQSANINQCENTTALFTVAANGTSPLTYQWYSDTGIVSGANANSYTIPSISISDAGNYYCVVSNGCGNISSSNKLLSVKTAPSILSQSANDTLCENMNAVLQIGVDGTNPISFQWYKNASSINGAVSSYYTLSSVDTNDAATYYAIATNSCGNVQSNGISLTVNQLAEIIFQSGDSSRCEGESMTFEVDTRGTHPINYQWYKGTNPVVGANSFQYQIYGVATNDAGYYHVNVSNICNSTTSSYKQLSVHENPVISLGNDTTFCSGGNISLSPGYGYQCNWSNGSFNNQINVTSTGSYFVNVTDQYGCGGISDTVAVNVLLPYSNQEICIVGVDSASNKNYVVWNKPSVASIQSFNIYKESSVSNVWNLIGNVDYDSLSVFIDLTSTPNVKPERYAITVVDSCGNESQRSSDHRTMHLTVNAGQSASEWNLLWNAYEGFMPSTYRIYRADSTMNFIKIDSIAGSSSYTYLWTDHNAPTGLVYYMVEIVHPQGGCSPTKANTNYNNSRSNTANNGIIPNVALVPEFIASQTTGVAPMIVMFYDQTTNGTVDTWYWNFGDGGNSVAQNPVHQYNSAGVYHVSLTVTNSNGTQSILKPNFIDVLPNGVQNLHANFDVSVFPNPYRGSTNIAYALTNMTKVKVEVYSSLGTLVCVLADENQIPGSYKYQFDANRFGFAQGVYYLRMKLDDDVITKRIVEIK